jgi:hypothetical protein
VVSACRFSLTRKKGRGFRHDRKEDYLATPKKTVVISDVHMSNGAAYSWFQEANSEKLVNMLSHMANDSNIGELVLLGDLFDLWLYPVDQVPWTVEQIIQTNVAVVEAIRKCVEKIPHVYYMNGNHDMGVKPHHLEAFKAGAKEVIWISPEDYAKSHDGWHLEHGHAVDMFNAPDESGDTIGGYPLGYFITRLVATAANQSEVWRALKDLYEMFGGMHRAVIHPEMAPAPKGLVPERFALPSIGSFLVEAIVTLLEKLAEVHDDTPMRFVEQELDTIYTVGDIKEKYGTLFDRWHSKYSAAKLLDSMLATHALDWYANDLLSEDPSLKVVVMGHTHASVSDGQYDNDGCWCIPEALGHGDADPTYTQIVGNSAMSIIWSA